MKVVYFEYNPFLLETKIEVDGKPVSSKSALHKFGKGRRLQEWLDNLFTELVAECNDDMEITFRGTKLDFDDVRGTLEKYERHVQKTGKKSVKIELKSPEKFAKNAKIRLQELIVLFSDMQNNCPFDDLKEDEIKRKFQDAIDTEFDVAVIATMSSGKSTLINAFLRRPLMPSKNTACTATIARIKDVNGKEKFTAICKGKEDSIIAENDCLTAEAMKQYNSDEKVLNIEIEGDIPFVSSEDMQLVLLDTPGTNTFHAPEHKELTYSIIKDDKNMPMVLYVMAKDKIDQTDEHTLLKDFADQMKKQHGKQARDRFVFVINKMDDIDIADEPVSEFIQKAKELLKEYEIEEANIYPVSAEVAKLIRMERKGYDLTSQQRLILDTGLRHFSDNDTHLNVFVPSQTIQSKMNEILESAQDEYDKTLIYTGVPALESAIAEYVERYAIADKIHTAVNTFNRQIREKQLMAQLRNKLSKDEDERKRVSMQMEEISKQLKDRETEQAFRKKIEGLDFDSEREKAVENVRAKFMGLLNSNIQSGLIATPDEARELANKLKRGVPELEADLKTDLQNMIKTCVIQNAREILNEYRKHITSLLDKTGAKDYDFDTTMDIMTAHLPDIDDLVDKYTERGTRTVKVDEKEVEDDTWWNFPLNPLKYVFGADTHMEDILKEEQYEEVDGAEVLKKIANPVWNNINDNIEKAEDKAKRLAENFKTKFVEELDKLNVVLSQKANELQQMASNKKQLDQQIQDNRINQKWLLEFQMRLDEIINV